MPESPEQTAGIISPASAARLRLLVLDVDGVLTDGRLLYGNNGEELKAFNIRDGLGIKLLMGAGIDVAIITGRRSDIVQRRARELGIQRVVQGREDKREALEELCAQLDLPLAACAYMGDDLPDVAAIRAAGCGLTVADACAAAARAADWQSRRRGGEGAVREACEALLMARGAWTAIEDGFL
ncbi:KdsC family phosphatase [Chromatocurvus halotolerans]|uniref:3-deoxy-D-manno-octulosonate 8-phosphate phosphatase KdsC n=1 Tax=Chromatocurvus halotolerans TaxID=1132028 RepID=A0A4R2KY42_9GAMM|nr:HAD-IIIA family hydrolase [Chromatocurvus halotolerans]TCO76226.1 3-deoxy-D-manno-octulosonate 8-phosphate phosphatase (KDO 8-P phosphatase) [Chromatocurvus halotolerans]